MRKLAAAPLRVLSRRLGLRSRLKLMQRSHFPGSCILYWDRLQEPPPAELPTKPVPVSGIIFTADTIMVQPTQTKFTFIWSAPNMVGRFKSCHVNCSISLPTSASKTGTERGE
jgi:hypothetical protein